MTKKGICSCRVVSAWVLGGAVVGLLMLQNIPQPLQTSDATLDVVSTTRLPLTENTYNFEGFDNVTGVEEYIVPNVVHYLRFDKPVFTFVDSVCVLAVFKNHKPEKIIFHTDTFPFQGPYWQKLENTSGLIDIIEIRYRKVPDTIYGQKFSDGWHKWHAGDVERIRILMENGGIFLDNDAYVVNSLDQYRHFEMTLNWDENQCLGTQVLLAHKDARFLRKWLESYRQYRADLWYYNAGEKPTKEVLYKNPELVHRVKKLFGADTALFGLIYQTYWPEWKKQMAMHLLINHRYYLDKEGFAKLPIFNETNILLENSTFGEMARTVYF